MLKINNNRELFFQWDVGQSLAVELAEGEELTEVHIGNDGCNKFYVVEPIDNLVAVYDELLQSGNKVIAYEYIKSGEEGHTIRKNVFTVVDRPKATDYAYTPTESYSWEYWAERARLYAESAADEVASIPTKMAEWWAIHKPEIMEEIKTAIPPYDDSEIRAEIDGIQQELNDKMEFYKVEAQGAYTNISFYHDGTRLYYNDLVEKYNDPRYFLYAEFEGLTFIPSLPPVDYDPILEFICTWIYGGKPHVARLVINSDNAGKYDGYDVVITGNLNEYTKKTYVDAQLQLRASASELNDVKENLSELDSTKVGYSEIVNSQLLMYSDSSKAHLLATMDLPSGGSVDDVKVNGTSVVSDGVANIPLAQRSTSASPVNYGAVGITAYSGLNVSEGSGLQVRPATNTNIANRQGAVRTSNSGVIEPYNLDYAVKCAMTDGKGAEWTAQEQANARKRIGEPQFELIEDFTTTEEVTTITRTAEPNGTPYSFSKMIIQCDFQNSQAKSRYPCVRLNDRSEGDSIYINGSYTPIFYATYEFDVSNGALIGHARGSNASTTGAAHFSRARFTTPLIAGGKITKVQIMDSVAKNIESGSRIKIYGVRA